MILKKSKFQDKMHFLACSLYQDSYARQIVGDGLFENPTNVEDYLLGP